MAGVTGLIVAIGFTADSFIVYFERVRDEVREGRSLARRGRDRLEPRQAHHPGRRRRSTSWRPLCSTRWPPSVRGFAFTLGLTTLIDLLVVFLFTHPVAHAPGAAPVLPRRPRVVRPRPAAPRGATDGPVRRPRSLHDPDPTHACPPAPKEVWHELSFATFGNDLYTGKRSVPSSAAAPPLLPRLGGHDRPRRDRPRRPRASTSGLEFRGGSEFRVAGAPDTRATTSRSPARRSAPARTSAGVGVTLVGNNTVRVQTERLSDTDSQKVRSRPGQGVRRRRVRGQRARSSAPRGAPRSASRRCSALVIFLIRCRCCMTRLLPHLEDGRSPALIALVHDLVITVGIYALDRVRGLAGDDDRLPHRARLLPLRHRRRLRQGPREHQRGVRQRADDLRAGGQPGRQPDPGPLDQHHRRRPAADRRGARGRRRFLGPGMLLDLSLVLFVGIRSAPTPRSSSPPRCWSTCARASRRSSSSTRGPRATRPARPRTSRPPRPPTASRRGRRRAGRPSAAVPPRPPRARARR